MLKARWGWADAYLRYFSTVNNTVGSVALAVAVTLLQFKAPEFLAVGAITRYYLKVTLERDEINKRGRQVDLEPLDLKHIALVNLFHGATATRGNLNAP